jgi:SAM-dependent methyltransferase
MSEDLDKLQHPKFAEMYIKQSPGADRRGASEHRARLLAGLSGRVVEVGAGNGRNFPHYPPGVTEVVAVEPDATFRLKAEEVAAASGRPVKVVPGHADALPIEDCWADVVVFSLVLCSVPDQATSLAEAARVLAPGGHIRYYEHVRSLGSVRGRLQDLIQPLWTWKAAGCHPNRATDESIRAAGFTITEQEEIPFAFGPFTPKIRHIVGRAVRTPGS